MHTTYQQAVAATGRLSSTDPNLQNIPIRTRARPAHPAGRSSRPAGLVLLAADYSQHELRILAHVSGDPRLKADFAAHSDIHLAAGRPRAEASPPRRSARRSGAWRR